jgi:hypothetical protein
MMVDYVALNDARVTEVKRQCTEDSEDMLKQKIERIPLNPVPSGKKDCPDIVGLKNELGFEAGQFGWCIVCRNSAGLFCKDAKHPVCSSECKMKH